MDRWIVCSLVLPGIFPLDTTEKVTMFFATFTSELRFAPKSWLPRPNDNRSAIRWSAVQALKYALVFFHRAKGWPCALRNPDPVLIDFWRGLKREAVHTVW